MRKTGLKRVEREADGERQRREEDAAWCIYMVLRLRIPLYIFATAFCVALNNSFLSLNTTRVHSKRAREKSLDSEETLLIGLLLFKKLKLALAEIQV